MFISRAPYLLQIHQSVHAWEISAPMYLRCSFIQGFAQCAVVVLHPRISPHVSFSSIFLSVVDYTSSYFIYLPILESSFGSSLPYCCLWFPFRDAPWQTVSWHPNHRNRMSSVTSLMYLGNIRAEIGCQLLALGILAFLVNMLTLSVSDF